MTEIMTDNAPSDWTLERIGQLFQERREKVSDKDFEPLSVTKNGVVPQMEHVAKSDDSDNRKLVRRGDFVINSRSDRRGSSGLAEQDGSVSVINTVLTPRHGYPRFLHYLLKSYAFQEEFYRYGHGIVADLWTTRMSDMKGIQVALPDLPTQKAIADFLDRETARIDQLIEKKQRLVELLEERRAGLATDLVTHGIEPVVGQKHSGYAWIGSIPSHWQTMPLKFATTKIVDGTHLTPTYQEEGVPFLRVTDISTQSSEIKWDQVRRIPEREHLELSCRAKARMGDLLLSKNGTVGIPRVVTWNHEFSFFVSLCLIRPTKNVDPFFLEMFFRSPIVSDQINDGSRKTSVTNLHLERIRELVIVLPPLDEQRDIVSAYQERLSPIAELLRMTQTSIERLFELRSSLITSSVTGHVDIGAWREGEEAKSIEHPIGREVGAG